MTFAKCMMGLMALCLASACNGENTSDASADYATLRVKRLILTDSAGKPVVVVTAQQKSGKTPEVVLRTPGGTLLRTVDVSEQP